MILRSCKARTLRPHWSACPCLIPAPVRYRVSNSHILHGVHFSVPIKYMISKSYILQVLVSDPDPQKSNSSIASRIGSSIFQNCIVQACHSRPVNSRQTRTPKNQIPSSQLVSTHIYVHTHTYTFACLLAACCLLLLLRGSPPSAGNQF